MQENKSWFSKARVETFSDSVFGIIITILVFGLKIPQIKNPLDAKELAEAILFIIPNFLSCKISFFMVCVVWVNHHRIFETLTHITYKVFWLNAFLLLWCALIPFPTALVGEYPLNKFALFMFGLVLSLTGVGFYFLRRLIISQNLLVDHISEEDFKKDNNKSLFFGCVLYLFGASAAYINPFIAIITFTLIPFYFIFLNVRAGRFLIKKSI